jgi:hypothetical protein
MAERRSVGYDITITRQEWCVTMDSGTEWRVDVVRLSDGEKLSRTFAWRRSARRFARSTRRLGKAYDRLRAYRDTEVERITVGWPDEQDHEFRDHEFEAPTVASATTHMRGIFEHAATGQLSQPREVAEHVAGWAAEALALTAAQRQEDPSA